MTDERLRKIHYRLCNWLFHDHADSIKMKYFNIPRKMRKKFGCCVACAVTCQMPIHQAGIFDLAFRDRESQIKNTLPYICEYCNASQRTDQRFYKTSLQRNSKLKCFILIYNTYLYQLPVELYEHNKALFSCKDVALVPKYSSDVMCTGNKLVIIDKYCKRVWCRGNRLVIVLKHGNRIYCCDNFLVFCSLNCSKTVLANNFIQTAV